MNNDNKLELLEQELAALKPRGLSETRKQRLITEISAGETGRRVIPFSSILTLTAAAASLMLAILFAFNKAPKTEVKLADAPVASIQIKQPDPLPEAPGIDTILVSSEDNGIVFLDDRTPVRKTKYRIMDRAHWIDPESGVKHEIIRPRSGVVLTGLRVD